MSWLNGSRAGFGRMVCERSARPTVIGRALFFLAITACLTGCGSGSGATPGPKPTPTVSSISPQSAPAAALAFTLTVNGSNFSSGSMVEWGGSSRATTLVSSSQLRAQIMQADLAMPGKVTVTVVNSGGGASSGVTFTVAADTIAYYSNRAFDGSDATNANRSRRALDGTDNVIVPNNIWAIKADGTGATPLTNLTAAGADSLRPVWSPDGRKIVFDSQRALDPTSNASNSNDTDNIWVMNADGSAAAPLTNITAANADSARPAWSPDGSKIVFDSQRALDLSDNANTNLTSNIWLVNADGSGATALTVGTALGSSSDSAVWSPGGNKIFFTSLKALDGSNARILAFNIWVVNADGTAATPLTTLTAVGVTNAGPRQP